jgi:hypothetical protein
VLGNRVATGQPFEGEDGEYRMPDLRLEAGFRVEGRVVGPAGEPVEGVMAWLHARRKRRGGWNHCRRAARSDAEGRLVFPPIPRREGWFLVLSLRPDGYVPRDEIVDAEAILSGARPEWTLSRGCALRGIVQGPDGEPESGVQVVPASLRGNKWHGWTDLRATTDGDGRFLVPVAPHGNIRLLLYPGLEVPVGSRMASNALPRLLPPLETRPGQELDLGALRYDACGGIRGAVRGPDGRPFEGANVRVTLVETGDWRSGTSDQDGTFVFPDLPLGCYRLEVWAKGAHPAKPAEVEVLPHREVGVELSLR